MKRVEYIVQGEVKKGYAQAGKRGYPTANLALAQSPEFPEGIYCAWTLICGGGPRVPSIVFYGIPHALPGVTEPRFEVHVFEKDVDLYGKELEVELVAFVRENKKFDDHEKLEAAIREDVEKAREYFFRQSN